MARTRPLQVVLSDEGEKTLKQHKGQTGVDASQVVRDALHLYFMARGVNVDFNPVKPGQRANRKDSGKGQGDHE